MTFDSLTFARRLKAAGFSEAQAEALADANRELMVPDLATKDDLTAVEHRIEAAMEALGLRLTIRLGVMIGVGVAILGAILRLH